MPRGRTENLNPVTTKEEARERGRAGGIESGKKRRQNKEMREILEQVLKLPIREGPLDKLTSSGNTRGKNYTTSEAIVLAQVQAAMRGDQKALQFVLEMSGQLAKIQQDQQPDDGFMDALNGAAKEVWSGDEVGDVPI